MNIDAKAREIAATWHTQRHEGASFFSSNMRADLVQQQIATALRDCERQTIERAAQVADSRSALWVGPWKGDPDIDRDRPVEDIASTEAEIIAARIRAMKEGT